MPDDPSPSLHSLSIQLAELRGGIDAHNQLLSQQVGTLRADIEREASDADREHADLWTAQKVTEGKVNELATWRSKATGLAIGIGIGSGVASGAIVSAITKTIGG